MIENTDTHNDHDSHDEEHHGGMTQYMLVFGALLVLTLASFLVGTYLTEYFFGKALMIAISCVKALLVMLFFMHLIWEANWKYVLTIPASFMSLFLVLALTPDIAYRTRWYAEERWLYAAEEDLTSHNDHGDHGADEHAEDGADDHAEAEKAH